MLEVKPFSRRDRKYHEFARRHLRRDWGAEDRARQIFQTAHDAERKNAFWEACGVHDGESIRVTEDEIDAAKKDVSEQFLTAVSLARVNIRKFHEDQRRRGYVYDEADGVRLIRQVRPLGRIGICCGRSFSALLMHAVPAQMAGVGAIAVCVQPDGNGSVDPRLLAVAKLLDIDEVYRLSGAEAVSALTFGIDPVVKPVDKIIGQDGSSCRAAKRLAAGMVGVDCERGMGELLVIADQSANARFIAGDLLAEAEHGGHDALAGLFCTDRLLAEAVRIEAERLADALPDADGVRTVLRRCGMNYVFPDLYTAVEAANSLAPARLSLQTRDNEKYLPEVETAGAVFLGPWSVEAAGDCFAGINPFLPLGGQARFATGLGLDEFIRELPVAEYSPDRFLKTGRHQAILAEEEGLPAHANSVRERLELLKLTVD